MTWDSVGNDKKIWRMIEHVANSQTPIKVQGVVRHKSKIREGKYSGCYILGIESPDITDSYKAFQSG